MLTVYEDFGAAIVIDDGIAIPPHARPEKGALQTGFSLVTTATPISFGHDEFDPVSVVIAIAGADADSHIKMIPTDSLADRVRYCDLSSAGKMTLIQSYISFKTNGVVIMLVIRTVCGVTVLAAH